MAKKNTQKKVESIRHKDKRANIPTEELRDFVADEELVPKTMLYPRDPSLDPQLVWKGKDEQDREELAVPVVPVYIQEKIHPQAIIDALPRTEQPGDDQANLFADFNGGSADFAQKIDFYHHKQNWSNRLILGDSLLVMTSLAEKEGLKGKVQTIYLDPPYGIKFGSNWQVSTRKRDVKDGKAQDATRQPEQVRAFRDTWKLGIHSYLAYLRDRLVVARDLLTETGSVFVQIGDENVHRVRALMDEVFGDENYVTSISFFKTGAQTSSILPNNSDTILWYAKMRERIKTRRLFNADGGWAARATSKWERSAGGIFKRASGDTASFWTHRALESTTGSEASRFPVVFNGDSFLPKRGWSTSPVGTRLDCMFGFSHVSSDRDPILRDCGRGRRAQSRITAADRKRRTRRLILMGSYLEHVTQADSDRKARLMKELDVFLERDRDRELFDLAPHKENVDGNPG